MDSTTHPLLSNDLLGWAAALLTLLTFVCRDMQRLRLLALAANAGFIAYGALAQLLPVLALQLALVPVNLWRLKQTLQPARRRGDNALSQARPEPERVGPWRPRHGRKPHRSRRAKTPGPVSVGGMGRGDQRFGRACAKRPAVQP